VELLKQPQYQPMEVFDQKMVIFAGNTGYLDDVPVKDMARWEKAFLQYMKDVKSSVRQAIVDKKELTDDIKTQLRAAIEDFKKQDRSKS
ncbi:MAG: F0F1 ATP synthase subunit alpha, partial [Planctomycetota bacterium]